MSATPSRPQHRVRRGLAEATLVAIGACAAGGFGFIVGGAGMLAVAGTVMAIAAMVAAWYVRDIWTPLLPGRTLPPMAPRRSVHGTPHRRRRRPLRAAAESLLVAVAAVAAGGATVVAGSLGLKGAAAMTMAVVGAVVLFAWRRELLALAFGDRQPGAPLWAREARIQLPAIARRSPNLPRPIAAFLGLVLLGGGVFTAWMAASLGIKGAALLVALIGLGALLAIVPKREDVMLFVLVCSLVLFLHKSVSDLYPVNSGAPAVYITSLGLILIILYGIWFTTGQLRTQLRSAFRRPIIVVPLLGALFFLPSLVVADELMLAYAELVRMAWMYMLFLYIAVRVRRASQIWTVLAGLGVFACVQLTVAALQFMTGGVLGLGFLGVPDELGERVVDDGGIVGRPFGTIVHPVFLGAVMASLGLLALAIGISLRERRSKMIVLAFVPVCVATLALSQARVALASFLAVATLVIVASTIQGRVTHRVAGRIAAGAVLALVLASPVLVSQYQQHFQNDHVSVEVQSRLELNDVAFEMIADHPVIGVGLNHFQDAMGPYDRYGLLFAGNPVHNLYLLQASETGYVGLAGLLLVGFAFLRVSLRLARAPDPLLGGLGTGISAVFVFFSIEEFAGFSLRQEIPLALWWLLAGLAVAGTAMNERAARARVRARQAGAPLRPHHLAEPRDTRRRVHRPRRRRVSVHGVVAVAILLPAIGIGMTRVGAASDDGIEDTIIVFAATDRLNGATAQAIYTANGDGSGITRVTPDDGAFYDFPAWAMGGTKIVYSRRDGGPGTPENIWMANPDGSEAIQLTQSPWRNHQPKVNAAGTHLVFSGFVPGTELVAIYELDLATLLVRNVSAVHSTSVMADADPRVAADGTIVFARSRSDEGPAKTQVWQMAADGTGRRALTDDDFYNLDPDISPDGGEVAYSSYQGEGTPQEESAPQFAKHEEFRIVVRNLDSGEERTLTGGADCLARTFDDPCDPLEASTYVPLWSPSGDAIGFVAPLSSAQVCLCVMRADGSSARILIAEPGLDVSWFDWIIPTAPPESAVLDPGKLRPNGRLLVTGGRTVDRTNPEAPSEPFLAESGEDWWDRSFVPLAFDVRDARWDRRRERIAMVVTTPVDAASAPGLGPFRRSHITLPELGVVFSPAVDRPEVATQQIFVVGLDGTPHQVTNPWLEDPLDGLAPGDARGNIDPDFSPDGRYLVFTNASAVTAESFILRLDLQTGEILNLTNATSGVLPVDDAQPRYSPDGRTIAFTSGFEGSPGVYLMDADTGTNVRRVSPGNWFDTAPAWSPDGRFVVYSSYRGDPLPLLESLSMPEQLRRIPLDNWVLVKTDVLTGESNLLDTGATGPAFSPVWSPDGRSIAFISVTDGFQPDLYQIPAEGGPTRLIQVTGMLQELAVDWR